jgi:hypothetical protein
MWATESSLCTRSETRSGKAQLVEAVARQFRIVADIAEQPRGQRPLPGYQVADLQIDGRTVSAAAEHPTQQVLLVERGMHQRGRNRICVEQQIHRTRPQMVIGLGTRAGAHRDEQQIGFRCGPAQPLGIQCRHQEQLEGGIVIRAQCAVAVLA